MSDNLIGYDGAEAQKHISGAKAPIDFAGLIAGDESPAYPIESGLPDSIRLTQFNLVYPIRPGLPSSTPLCDCAIIALQNVNGPIPMEPGRFFSID